MKWIVLVLIYGILKGIRDVSKKKALEKNGVTEVLFVYTLIAFCLVLPDVRNAGGVAARDLLLTAFKSFVIFIAFLCGFIAIDKMPIGIYGIVDLSRMVFSLILGVIILKETMGFNQYLGMALVIIGLLLLKYIPVFMNGKGNFKIRDKEKTVLSAWILVVAFISTFLNAVSGILDKILMRTMTSSQLQFWYMLFMLVYYGLYVLISRTKIDWKSVLKNPHVWLIAVLFIIADRCLFLANGDPASKVTVMTILKQICVIVTIVGGRIVFKEKNMGYKIFCALVVSAGVVISAL
ncbi:MAG: DMT family transporter [Lachnospiraceae bacterium]|nr:DMT family transporter [Lachnospiraceae bacterium]